MLDKLKEARLKAGLTQAQMAKICEISVLAYQQYEYGKRIPRADVAVRIAEALGSTVEHLFGERK